MPTSTVAATHAHEFRLPDLPKGKAFSFYAGTLQLELNDSAGVPKLDNQVYHMQLSLGVRSTWVDWASSDVISKPFDFSRRPACAGSFDRTWLGNIDIYRQEPVVSRWMTNVVYHKELLAADITKIAYRLYYDLVSVTDFEAAFYAEKY